MHVNMIPGRRKPPTPGRDMAIIAETHETCSLTKSLWRLVWKETCPRNKYHKPTNPNEKKTKSDPLPTFFRKAITSISMRAIPPGLCSLFFSVVALQQYFVTGRTGHGNCEIFSTPQPREQSNHQPQSDKDKAKVSVMVLLP